MRIAIDTNRYRDLRDGVPEVIELLTRVDQICVPFVVVVELQTGFGQGKRRFENEKLLASFLRKSGVDVLYPDTETLRHYVELFLQLRLAGRPIPLNDLWIAALCVQHGLSLFTRDKHFNHLPKVGRV